MGAIAACYKLKRLVSLYSVSSLPAMFGSSASEQMKVNKQHKRERGSGQTLCVALKHLLELLA